MGVLCLILLAAAAAKVRTLPGTGPFGADGSYYANAARNVQEGRGLVSNVSMYHRGETQLPVRAREIYPMFPLLVGFAARLIGFFPAVNVLPPLLYLLDIVLLYLMGQKLAARFGVAGSGWFGPGHVLAFLLATNVQFYGPTTYPYTEGLGFFFAFSTVLLLDRAVEHRPAVYGALAGLAGALALYTRSQLVIVGLGAALALVWVTFSERRMLPALVSYLLVFGGMFAFWYFQILHVDPTPTVSLQSGFQMWVEPKTRLDWWKQRWEGVLVSIHPLHPNSYFHAFYLAFLFPLAAFPVAAVRWISRGPRRFRTPASLLLPAACIAVAFAAYASLNLFRQDESFSVPWLFGYRHGLPLIFGVAVALAYLWSIGRTARSLVVLAAGLSIVFALISLSSLFSGLRSTSPTPAEAGLARWLDAHERTPLLISARSQHLSVYTHANIHWTECRTSSAVTRRMLETLPIDYVVVYASERPCAFVKGLGDLLVETRAFGDSTGRIHVLGRRPGRGPMTR